MTAVGMIQDEYAMWISSLWTSRMTWGGDGHINRYGIADLDLCRQDQLA
jgi:hypothetical protein